MEFERLFIALGLGALSGLHCLGMCGGIAGALAFSLPPEIRENRRVFLVYLILYNLGRILSYAAAGALFGGFGATVFVFLSPTLGHDILQALASVVLAIIGLHMAGFWPQFARIEVIGDVVWQKLQPLGHFFLPANTPFHAFAYGMVWGWLPCGVVYSALLWATTAGSWQDGGLSMLAFGLGTLPVILSLGSFTQIIRSFERNQNLKQAAGLIVIGFAAFNLYTIGDCLICPFTNCKVR